jgi:hypothetical protein
MPIITTTVAVGKWENRASLEYFPVNGRINGKRFNAFGIQIDHPNEKVETRRPFKIDDGGSVVYICYDSDADTDIPIYRIEEV